MTTFVDLVIATALIAINHKTKSSAAASIGIASFARRHVLLFHRRLVVLHLALQLLVELDSLGRQRHVLRLARRRVRRHRRVLRQKLAHALSLREIHPGALLIVQKMADMSKWGNG